MRHKIYCTSDNDNRQIAVRQWVEDYIKRGYVGGVNGGFYAFLKWPYFHVGSVLDAADELVSGNYDIDDETDYRDIADAIDASCDYLDSYDDFMSWCVTHRIKLNITKAELRELY